MTGRLQLAIIGGGPAGLRAAECASAAGIRVTLFDGKPSVGRKFLVAGRGGLNLTHGEAFDGFASRYSAPPEHPGIWRSLLEDFRPQDSRDWAAGLGVETFEARTGRVYPRAMKAAPLLRAWIARLKQAGVRFEMNHRFTGINPGRPHRISFAHGSTFEADAVLLALGGASWPQTGSDGSWIESLQSAGIDCHPLLPANCGWECPWPADTLAMGEGLPLKNIEASAGQTKIPGELLITRYGLEGGLIYQLGPILRGMSQPAIAIDFKPTFTAGQLMTRMESVKRHPLEEARIRWKLPQAAVAILSRKEWNDSASLAAEAKHCVIPLTGPRPIAEAISSAGGVCWRELDDQLMLRAIPGCFLAGEMIDWEAPTGGYLMQGCLATGTRAGTAAARWLRERQTESSTAHTQ